MSHNSKWKRKKAAQMMLSGASVEQIAARFNARKNTIIQWRSHPDFIEEFTRIRADLEAQMRTQLYMMGVQSFNQLCASYLDSDCEEDMFESARDFFKHLTDQDMTQLFTHEVPNIPPRNALKLTEIAPLLAQTEPDTNGNPPKAG